MRVGSDVGAWRFGTFRFDADSCELSKAGRPLKVQQQPLHVLRALLEQPGELVSREALRQRLWPDGVNVEFDQSLNKSLTKLRDALGDAASNPRFIETLPKRGYRFIAPVTREDDPAVAAVLAPQASSTTLRAGAAANWLVVSALSVAAVGAASLWWTTAPTRVLRAREQRPTPPPAPVGSPIHAAKDAFERGRLALARRSPESLHRAAEHFQRAVVLSPRFADAHVGVADSWSLLSSYGLIDPREGMPRARDAANRALTLDPSLARAHASLARTVMIFDWDWMTAGWHFARAVELSPGDPVTHQWHAYYLSAVGKHDDAVEEARRAVASDPLSLNSHTALGFVLYLARRFDEAAAQLERTLEIDPDFAQARRNLALVRVQQRRLGEAAVAMKRVAVLNESAPVAAAELAWVLALSGERDAARAALADLDRQRASAFVPPDAVALIYAGLGATDEATAWLQRAFMLRVPGLAHLPVDPVWDSLREHTAVRTMIEAIRPH
jgi:DNA-binding winged helix-turn-helix (wHTH) protein/Tfp pilus assembly protein PilF